ncbi:hypothetical protein DPQ33_06310 [Oceanidesulfovibrio indonesiensis]|uniref:Lipoprotein n=2 Tax=Oceanidesulfovibrio indonesiensis TaxID=54767 RepID=A0A7M3MGB5_9BACT|nr:hypothetical protein DPQ33_06310 [Oceanidesulfovibrio indonesiensis]
MKKLLIVSILLYALALSGCGSDTHAQTPEDKFAGTWISSNHSMYIWPCGEKYILEYTYPDEDIEGHMNTIKVPATPRGNRLLVTVRFDEIAITAVNSGDLLMFQDKPYKRTQTVTELDKRRK